MASPQWVRIRFEEDSMGRSYYVPIFGNDVYTLSENSVPQSIFRSLKNLNNPSNYLETYDMFKNQVPLHDYIDLIKMCKKKA